MTDHELLNRVISSLDPSASKLRMVRRNGRLLLGLPSHKEAAAKALNLYQPQRATARIMVAALNGLTRLGLHACLLRQVRIQGKVNLLSPPLSGIEAGTCGVLLGSPEHRVRRAIASYRNDGQWEVAKISFGEAGAQVLEQEALTLGELGSLAAGVPRLLGLHQGKDVTVLRMPYLTGRSIPPGESKEPLHLLDRWISSESLKPADGFPEWPAIESSLSEIEGGRPLLEWLSRERLRPVICHGDFARWNLLKQTDGRLLVLDWEWGREQGMPGIDLVHYFLQDARLVKRMATKDAVAATLQDLKRPECMSYLQQTGWSGDPLLPIIACLAYKQGAGHQDNREILKEILEFGFTAVPQTGHEAS